MSLWCVKKRPRSVRYQRPPDPGPLEFPGPPGLPEPPPGPPELPTVVFVPLTVKLPRLEPPDTVASEYQPFHSLPLAVPPVYMV